ncbi:MAG: penicillin-binding protein activator [Desulfosudaceae bacterium]
MKRRLLILFMIMAVTVALWPACAPREVVPLKEPGQALFDKAEQHYQAGAYDQAFELYTDYLSMYPEGRRAPEALLKTAGLLAARKEHEQSRKIYRRLVNQFPDSRQADAAHLGLMRSWFNEGRYEKVLDYADTLEDRFLPESVRARKSALVAEAYLETDNPVDAAYVLISALKNLSERQQHELMPSLDRVTEKVGIGTLRNLLANIKNPDVRGQLTCRISGRFIKSGNYEAAVDLLSDYIERFPDNLQAAEAEWLLSKIKEEADYDHHAIGCLLPLSGKYRHFGNQARRGVQYAFQKLAASDRAAGEEKSPVRLVIRDSGSDPEQAVQGVRELLEEKVAAIIGPLVTSREALAEAQKNNVPIIALSREDDITEIGDYVFRNFLTPKMQVRSLVSYACGEKGWRRLAVLFPDEQYGREFAHTFWDEILRYDAEIVGFESYDPEYTDFADSIEKLVGLYYPVPEDLEEAHEKYLDELGINPETEETGQELLLIGEILEEEPEEEPPAIVDFDALFIPDGPTKAKLIVPQLIFHDVVDTVFMGTNLWYSRELVDSAGKYLQGAMMPAAFWEKSRDWQVRQFVDGFSGTFGKSPDFIAAVSYDTANILFDAIVDQENDYRSDIRNRLRDLADYDGVTGRTSFDEKGEVHKALPLLKIKGRSFYRTYQPDTPGSDFPESP